jgi:hypothetical protein
MTLVTFLGDVWMPAVVRHATREFAMLQCRGCGGRFARRRVWQAAQCRGGLWPPSKQPLRVYRVIMFLNFIVYYSFLYLNLIGRLTNIVPTDIYERSWRELKKRLPFFSYLSYINWWIDKQWARVICTDHRWHLQPCSNRKAKSDMS